jgi:acyl-CoA synthetase (AMP-forming)/AMP-acid ligase II
LASSGGSARRPPILLPNRPDFVASFFGAIKIGARSARRPRTTPAERRIVVSNN